MIPISVVQFDADVERSVLEVLRSGAISQGVKVAELERRFAELCGVGQAVAVNNGTTALVAALQAAGIGPGDEVIAPAFTFVATVNAILQVGATARLVDIGWSDFAMDPAAAAAAITADTAAVLPVHLYGQPADIGKIQPLAQEHGIQLIEDAAQAHGARFEGRAVGSFGVGCFSFYATKNLVAGEGGMITTDDEPLAERLRVLRNQGMRTRYVYEMVGNNYRMTDLAAAVVLPQLDRYPDQVRRRGDNAARLTERLRDIDGLEVPTVLPGRDHVWHQYTVRVTGRIGRDGLASRLADRQVGSGIYYPRPIQQYDIYREHPRVLASETPVADQIAATCLSLPVHAYLTADDVDKVADAVAGALT